MVTKDEIDQALSLRHTKEVQEQLERGRVAIAGLGGLGSNIAFFLARIGVGSLHLIDYDFVDLSNLNRQQYRLMDVGRYKTEALKEQLLQINPYLTIKTDCVKITDNQIVSLFQEDDIICEAFDQADQKAMLVNGILMHYPKKYIVAASGLGGYESSNLIRTTRKFGHFYLCGDETAGLEDGFGLMAPRAALCAAHQANMVTRILLKQYDV